MKADFDLKPGWLERDVHSATVSILRSQVAGLSRDVAAKRRELAALESELFDVRDRLCRLERDHD